VTIQLTRRAVAIALVAFLAVAGLAAASFVRTLAPAEATHRFPDVGTNNFFHESSGAIRDAGCADGFGDGTFRPNNPATRGQFGYWTHNCASRVAAASGPAQAFALDDTGATGDAPGYGPEVTVATTTIEVGNNAAGAPTGRTQFVTLTGYATMSSPSGFLGWCPIANEKTCGVDVRLYEGATLLATGTWRSGNADYPTEQIMATWVGPARSGSHTYTMKMATDNGDSLDIDANNRLIAMTSTFGSTGANTLSTDGDAAPRAVEATPGAPPAP
jgi:hypothetical protein